VDAHHQTGNPKYFAGGDCVNGGGEVVDAVAEGMTAARGIDSWLAASPGSSSGSSRERD
jgi:glutamate synthase (NADPH/NADH) small chain